MDQSINSYILRITGGAELPGELDTKNTIHLSAEVDIYEVSKKDNFDGTFDIIYKAKPSGIVETVQGDIKMRGKDKKRMSQKLRAIMYIQARDAGEDTNAYYEKWMGKLISNWESVQQALRDL